jgi:hypothetical protein
MKCQSRLNENGRQCEFQEGHLGYHQAGVTAWPNLSARDQEISEMVKSENADEANRTSRMSSDEILRQGVTHPTIHIDDYYKWRSDILSESKGYFEQLKQRIHTGEDPFPILNAAMMWAWTMSREKLKEKARL